MAQKTHFSSFSAILFYAESQSLGISTCYDFKMQHRLHYHIAIQWTIPIPSLGPWRCHSDDCSSAEGPQEKSMNFKCCNFLLSRKRSTYIVHNNTKLQLSMDLVLLEQNSSKFCMKVFGELVITFQCSVFGWVDSSCLHVSTGQPPPQHVTASASARDSLCVSMWRPSEMTQCCSPFQTIQISLVCPYSCSYSLWTYMCCQN